MEHPGEKMKTPHVVPLSLQAIHIIWELQPLTGQGNLFSLVPGLFAGR
jgi:hypothetical protein